MNCVSLFNCLSWCIVKNTIIFLATWCVLSIFVFIVNFFLHTDKEPEELGAQLIEFSLIKFFRKWIIKCFVWIAEKRQKNQEEESKNNKKRNQTQDLLSIANTLIKKAKEGKTITFSEICKEALEEEWKGRKWLKYITKRLDIIGHCCKENDFPFINGLTREKYSYKINRGFWQPSWKTLLPIKLYEDQTKEDVEKFQQEIFDKIKGMTEEEIKEFLEKLKNFEPI